ncbi:Rpp20 subunit of nuclear RNase MRP and P-domain-containing protein [Aspergillus crustosus]
MAQSKRPRTSISDLLFERKNHDMVKLPKYVEIQKRPIPHAPVSSPYAGPSVPKTIYISSSTPYMSAVKRVQKLLRHAEKRATASLDATINSSKKSHSGSGNIQRQEKLLAALARGEEGEQLSKEQVFVKATGRAMGVALKVGKWFEREERGGEYIVRVKTGSVMVVDDVEVDEEGQEKALKEVEREVDKSLREVQREVLKDNAKEVVLREGGKKADGAAAKAGDDTIMTTGTTTTAAEDTTFITEKSGATATTSIPTTETIPKPPSKSSLRKRKRAAKIAASLAESEIPETRTRWVNSVEVAISLK